MTDTTTSTATTAATTSTAATAADTARMALEDDNQTDTGVSHYIGNVQIAGIDVETIRHYKTRERYFKFREIVTVFVCTDDGYPLPVIIEKIKKLLEFMNPVCGATLGVENERDLLRLYVSESELKRFMSHIIMSHGGYTISWRVLWPDETYPGLGLYGNSSDTKKKIDAGHNAIGDADAAVMMPPL